MYKLTTRRKISASHRLVDYSGACANDHGHSFQVEATLIGDTLGKGNILVDFKAIKNVIDELDHTCLNAIDDNPTAEYLAKYYYEKLSKLARVEDVKVWEGDDCYVSYSQ